MKMTLSLATFSWCWCWHEWRDECRQHFDECVPAVERGRSVQECKLEKHAQNNLKCRHCCSHCQALHHTSACSFVASTRLLPRPLSERTSAVGRYEWQWRATPVMQFVKCSSSSSGKKNFALPRWNKNRRGVYVICYFPRSALCSHCCYCCCCCHCNTQVEMGYCLPFRKADYISMANANATLNTMKNICKNICLSLALIKTKLKMKMKKRKSKKLFHALALKDSFSLDWSLNRQAIRFLCLLRYPKRNTFRNYCLNWLHLAIGFYFFF